ncbi:MAG TPA: ABC transporter ATP-binding protein [Acidimicrobiales bacterium]|nr:ABC transporter ATP-binding protein [Acidimicrobiales bacterium]
MSPLGGAEPLLEVEGLTVDFRTDDGVVRAVRDLSYDLSPGEVLGIVGESGSGKSVSSMALLGLLPRTATVSGSAVFRGEQLLGMPEARLNAVRGKRIAMIFQDPMTSLNPVHRVGDQIAEAILSAGNVDRREAERRAIEALDLVGIPHAAQRARGYPHEFSGGMRQRAMIAMAMANDPDLIIADEPTTALDVTVQAQILETLRRVRGETKAALLLITHDLGVVANMADRVLVMYAGRAVERGTVDEIYDAPRMPYTVGLLGSLPRLDTDADRLTPITGSPPSLLNLPPGCPFEPRCPMAGEPCATEEPPLEPTETPGHDAACHFSDRLGATVRADEVFATTSVDDVAEADAT